MIDDIEASRSGIKELFAQRLPAGTEGYHEIPQPGYPASRPRIESDSFWVQVKIFSATPAWWPDELLLIPFMV